MGRTGVGSAPVPRAVTAAAAPGGGDPPPPPTAPTHHHRSPWSSWSAWGIQHKKNNPKTTLFYSCSKISVTLFSCKVTYTKYDHFCSEGIEIKIES